jgi:hypothetical protein
MDNNIDDIVMAARKMFEMYTALIESGFNEEQALHIITEMLKSAS